MMKPTKVWTFEQVYSIGVLDGNSKLTAEVSIGWECGQCLYDRACLDLFSAATELRDNEWTISECDRVESALGKPSIRSFSVVNQFVGTEALQLSAELKATLKELSGLP